MKTWGKQHGYSLILGTTCGGNILQAVPELDVTGVLLKDLNDHFRDFADTGYTERGRGNSGKKNLPNRRGVD
jgi:hypothetical protein